MAKHTGKPATGATFTIRPNADEHAELIQICAELRTTEGRLILDFMRDALDMLKTGQVGVPKTVKMIQVLREHKATYTA